MLHDQTSAGPSSNATMTSVSIFITVLFVGVCLIAVILVPRLNAQKHNRRRTHSTSSSNGNGNYATKVGPRIIAPPAAKPPTGSPKATRKRLASILSTTLSYFSSSSSCSTSDIESSDAEDCAMLLLSYPEWVKDHLYDLASIQVGNKLGEGQYGFVYKAIVVHDNARWPVALKRIKKDGFSPEEIRKQQDDLLTEGKIMASIEYHDNIANLQVGETQCPRNFVEHFFSSFFV